MHNITQRMAAMMQFNPEIFEDILLKRSIHKDTIIKALEEVKNFIIRANSILVGGMAIDMALRSVGKSLYDNENILPDYDIISAQFHLDAYELARILHSKGFPNVQAINGLHPSTMRVRVNFTVVADITYIPAIIIGKIPYIKTGGFRVVHPHYQMLDQHVALSHPYAGVPRENIIGDRWKKDIFRHNLLISAFPMPRNIKSYAKTTEFKIPLSALADQCVGGSVALQYWIKKAILLGATIPKLHSTFDINNKTVSCTARHFVIYSECAEEVVKTLKTLKAHELKDLQPVSYNSLLEKIPKRIEYGNYVIFQSAGEKISAQSHSQSQSIWFANLQTIMVHTLCEWVIYKTPDALNEYNIAHDLLWWASAQYISGGQSQSQSQSQYLQFLPTAETYGKSNVSNRYKIYKTQFDDMLEERPHKPLTPSPLYFETKKVLIEFNPDESELYKIGGEIQI